jgi:DUF1365 family protein
VTGDYQLHVPEPDRWLDVAITLRNPAGATVFAATMAGPVSVADTTTMLRAVVAVPVAPLLVALRIRWQGIRLWARGLSLVPRPQERIR